MLSLLIYAKNQRTDKSTFSELFGPTKNLSWIIFLK